MHAPERRAPGAHPGRALARATADTALFAAAACRAAP
jgi:hypothetical protein